MRQIRKDSSGNGVLGGFPKEGMREGPAEGGRFGGAEIAYLKTRRAELILEGKKDARIYEVLAGEMKRTFGSIKNKIKRSVLSGELGENPNNKCDFSKTEIAYLKKRRAELLRGSKKDWQIARILAGEMKRPRGSIGQKISELVESGELPENPNKKELRYFTEEDYALIKKRRTELILEGKTDREIARVLAGEMERSAGSIRAKMDRRVESGELPENPNNRCFFSEDEFACITKRRAELILEGKKDREIARVLAGEIKRSASSIDGKIRNLIEGKVLGKNPNRKGGQSSEDELATELSAAVDMYLGDSP